MLRDGRTNTDGFTKIEHPWIESLQSRGYAATPMVSKLWLNLLIWGLGDRLEKKDDYKTDLLLVLDLMVWYSLLSLSAQTGDFLIVWLVAAAIKTPQIWIVT